MTEVIAVRAHAQRAATERVRETVRAVVALVVKARTKRFGGKVPLACGAAAIDPREDTAAAAAAAAAKNNDDNEDLPPPLALAVKPSIAMAVTDRASSDEQVERIEKEEHKSNEKDGDAESERESEERESAMQAVVLRKRRLMTIEAVSNNREFWLGPTKESNWVIPGKLLVGAYPLMWEIKRKTRRVILHKRDLIRLLHVAHVNTFVCLQAEHCNVARGSSHVLRESEAMRVLRLAPDVTEPRDRRQVMFPYMEDAAALSGLDGLRLFKLPIVDLQCTSDANVLALAVDLVQLIASGGHEVVYMHCWGGHGRTGTLVAVMLSLYYGIDAEEALLRTQLYHDIRRTKLEVRSPQTKEQCAQVRRILASVEAREARRRLMRLSVSRPTRSLFEVDWRRAALGLDNEEEEEDEKEVCVSCADVGESSLGVLETKTDGALDETALGYTEDDLQLELKDHTTTTTSQLVARAKTPEMALLERGASGDSFKGATSQGHDDNNNNGDRGGATVSADLHANLMDVESKDDGDESSSFASPFAKNSQMDEEKKWDDVASEECDEEDDDVEDDVEDDEDDDDEDDKDEEEEEEEEEKDGEEKLEVHSGAILTALPSPALGSPWGAGSLLVSPVSATSFSTAATNEMKLDTPVFGDMNTRATTTLPHPMTTTTATSMTPATEEDEAETPRSFEAMICGSKASAASAGAAASAPGSACSKARQRKRKPKLLSPKFRRTLRLASSSSSSSSSNSSSSGGSERSGQGPPMRPRPPDAASADRGSGARRRGPSPRQKLAAFHPVSF